MHCNYQSVFSILTLFFLVITSHAQTGATIKGIVLDEQNQPVIGASVVLTEKTIGTHTDVNGKYFIDKVPSGKYTIKISSIGYISKTEEIILKDGQQSELNITLVEDVVSVSEVAVVGKSKTTRIKESSFSVNSISTKSLENRNTDVNQILNQSSGVRIKESGGLGSNYDFSLNGLTGKQIRIFVDDIPVDQLGSSYNLNNLPVNLVERIDVFKGVVPIHLGADALGGAVNIVTNKSTQSFLDASYSFGSFNTHRATLNSRYRFKKSGFTVNASGFYNYSDNNYTMKDMEVFINNQEQTINAKRFHDQYQSAMGTIGLGFTKTKWADEFMIKGSMAKIDQQLQTGYAVYPAVGEAREEEKNATASFTYSKSNIFKNKMDVTAYFLYSRINSLSIDTSSNRYDWTGNIKRTDLATSFGELSPEKLIFEFNQAQYLARFHTNYKVKDNHQLGLNYLFSKVKRQGKNILNIKDNEPFSSPNTIQKSVLGLAYESHFFDKRLENVISVKHYNFNILARRVRAFVQNQFEIDDIRTIQNNIGYAVSSRYFIKENWFVKASFEKGYRIPEAIEIFGDGFSIIANPELKVESSYNFNVGMSHTLNKPKVVFRNELNLFYRMVDNFIRIQQSGHFLSYVNLTNVLTRGVEWDFLIKIKELDINGNFTWQSVLNNQKYFTGTTTPSSVYRDQMPNTPYLFGNLNVSYRFTEVIKKMDFSVFYTFNYVHKYYLVYPSTSRLTTKNIIPTQFVSNLGITFSSKDGRYNVSGEVRNLFDAKAYDNFRLQKPGRAFSLKIRYFLK